jgi:hypothetical protein
MSDRLTTVNFFRKYFKPINHKPGDMGGTSEVSEQDKTIIEEAKERFLFFLSTILCETKQDEDRFLSDILKQLSQKNLFIKFEEEKNLVTVGIPVQNLNLLSFTAKNKHRLEEISNLIFPHNFRFAVAMDMPNVTKNWRENIYNQAVFETSAITMTTLLHKNNKLRFRSKSEVTIYNELLEREILFFPLPYAVMNNDGKTENKEPDFLCCYKGKWGILEVVSDGFHSVTADADRSQWFKKQGADSYPVSWEKCLNEPEKVINDFIAWLQNK